MGVFSYSVSLLSQWMQCAVVVQYTTAGSVSLLSTAPTVFWGLSGTTGVASTQKFSLPVGGSSVLTLVSSRDGNYTLNLTRAAFSVRAVTLQSGTANNGAAQITALTFTPSFVSGSLSGYSVSVSYVITGVYVSSVFVGGTVSASFNGTATTALTSGATNFSPVFLLPVGLTVISVNSSWDSAYSVQVWRAGPALSALALNGQNVGGTVSATMNTALTPTFVGGTYTYSLTVAYVYAQLSVQASLASGTLWSALVSSSGVVSAQWLQTGVLSAPFNLTCGNNQLVFASSADGNYTLFVTRLPANLSSLSCSALSVLPPCR